MFCKNCGAEINDDARFCPKCGTDRTGEVKKSNETVKEDNSIQFQLKPKFNLPYKIICSIGRAILYLFLITYVIGVEIYMVFPIVLVGIIAVLVIAMAIHLVFEKMQYNDLEYNFYNTKVEYKDGFLNKEEKELKYKYIREVTMTQNILERIFNIGTIRVFTNASSASYTGRKHNTNARNGLYIHCVENVKEQYQKVKELIDEGTPED